MSEQSLHTEAGSAWVPEKRFDSSVEIVVAYYDDKLLRYVHGGVSPQRYAELWDKQALKFQSENLPRPEGCPTRDEVEAFLRGKIKAVSRRTSSIATDGENAVFARDPPAYHLSKAVRDRLGMPPEEDDDDERVIVQPARRSVRQPTVPATASAAKQNRAAIERAALDTLAAELGWNIEESVRRFQRLPTTEKNFLRAYSKGEPSKTIDKERNLLAGMLCMKLLIPVNQRGFRRDTGLVAVIARYDSRSAGT